MKFLENILKPISDSQDLSRKLGRVKHIPSGHAITQSDSKYVHMDNVNFSMWCRKYGLSNLFACSMIKAMRAPLSCNREKTSQDHMKDDQDHTECQQMIAMTISGCSDPFRPQISYEHVCLKHVM